MAWKLNKKLLENHPNTKERMLWGKVGEATITEISKGSAGELDYLRLASGEYIYEAYSEVWDNVQVTSSAKKPDPDYWLSSTNQLDGYFTYIESENIDNIQRSEEYYTFLGDKYFTKGDLVKAIQNYGETECGGVYYYLHHKVEEHTLEVGCSEKVSGEYDQPTLDKVNEILKAKGIDFVLKGE